MEIILISEVSNLGHAGTIVDVKNGYARNYLLPRKLAVRKTPTSLRILGKKQKEFEKQREEKNKQYKQFLDTIGQIKAMEIKRKVGESDKLFGSVTNTDIAHILKENHQIEIDKRQIVLKKPIRLAGIHSVLIQLNKDHKIELSVSVIPDVD